jgi:hypothetical protein
MSVKRSFKSAKSQPSHNEKTIRVLTEQTLRLSEYMESIKKKAAPSREQLLTFIKKLMIYFSSFILLVPVGVWRTST